MPDYEFTTAQTRAIHDGAVRAYNVGRGLLELSDCKQEAYLWAYNNWGLVEKWLEDEHDGVERLRQAAYHAGVLLVRVTMRQNGGTKSQDFATYAPTAVQDLLPTVFLDVSFQTGQEVNEEIHHKTSPNEGGVGLAMVADIKSAFRRLTAEQKKILFLLYSSGDSSYDDVAKEMDISSATVRRREQRALEAIVDALGGPRVEARRRQRAVSRV